MTETPSVKFPDNFTENIAQATQKRAYRRLLFPVARQLGEGVVAKKVCENLGLSKQLVYTYKEKAFEKDFIRLVSSGRTKVYGPGPRFNEVLEGGDSRLFDSKILCRTHLQAGSYYIYDGINTLCNEDGFRTIARSDATNTSFSRMDLDTPGDIIGYAGAKMTLELRDYLTSPIKSELRITPSPVYQDESSFSVDCDPFVGVLDYSLSYLRNELDWMIPCDSHPRPTRSVHYAFEVRFLGSWLDPLLPCIHNLTRNDGGSYEVEGLWLDRSLGRNHPELETSRKQVALNIFAIESAWRRDNLALTVGNHHIRHPDIKCFSPMK